MIPRTEFIGMLVMVLFINGGSIKKENGNKNINFVVGFNKYYKLFEVRRN